jgi:hypothetical protein
MKRILPVLALALALAVPAAGWAQVLDLRLGANGPAFTYGRASGRLDAMGGMLIVVPDEASELNMLDFGDNITGVLGDRDSWSTDIWARSTQRTDRTLLDRRRRINSSEEGLLFVSRLRGNRLALGGLVSRVDGSFSGLGEDSQTLTGSAGSIYYAQAFGSRLVLGGRFASQAEDENLRSDYVFAIAHASAVTQGGAAVAYQPVAWLDLGVSADYVDSKIDGVSSSGVHRDLYDWSRPTVQVAGQALGRFGKASAGLLYRWTGSDGREEVEINWADRFLLNPTRQNISWRGPTMKEELDRRVALGRFQWTPSEGTTIGAMLGYLGETNKVTKKSNFDSSLPATDTDAWTGLGVFGASRWFMDERLLGAVEFRRERTSTDYTEERWAYNLDSYHTEIGAGAEYFWKRDVLVRGGLLRSTHGQDQGIGTIEHAGYGVTLGLGYVPSGGLLQIDAGYRFLKETPDDASKTLAEQEGLELGKLEVQAFTVSARLLF